MTKVALGELRNAEALGLKLALGLLDRPLSGEDHHRCAHACEDLGFSQLELGGEIAFNLGSNDDTCPSRCGEASRGAGVLRLAALSYQLPAQHSRTIDVRRDDCLFGVCFLGLRRRIIGAGDPTRGHPQNRRSFRPHYPRAYLWEN
jgi:hypothetical protein